jgi:hypothetical protein
MKEINELAGIAVTVVNSLTALWLSTNQLAIIGATVLSSEMVLWLPLPYTAKTLVVTLQKSQKILLSKHVSDDRKERIIPFYAFRIFKNSLFLPLLIAVLISPIMLVSWLLAPSILSAVTSLAQPFMILIMIFTSALYLMIRMRFSR